MAKTLDPDERRQLRAEAKKLRRKKMTYQEIGDVLGISNTTVCEYCTGKVSLRRKAWKERNPERVRAHNLKRNKAKQEWASGECPQCGGHFATANGHKRSSVCVYCATEDKERAARERCLRYIDLRLKGMSNVQIAEQEGCSRAVVNSVFSRAYHRYGLTVPRSPYFKAPA